MPSDITNGQRDTDDAHNSSYTPTDPIDWPVLPNSEGQALDSLGFNKVRGPASSLDGEIPLFDGTTGKRIKSGSGLKIDNGADLIMSLVELKNGQIALMLLPLWASGTANFPILSNASGGSAPRLTVAGETDVDLDILARALGILNLGAAGDTLLGDGTLRAMYPHTDKKINLGVTGANRFNDLFLGGDLNFESADGGITRGEIKVSGNTAETVISGIGEGNKVQYTFFDTNGPSNNTTPDHTNNHITITKAGIYLVNACIHVDSVAGAAAKIGFQIYKNDGATELDGLHSHRNLGGGGSEAGSANICGFGEFAVNDTVEMWVWNETNTQNVIGADMGIALLMAGGV